MFGGANFVALSLASLFRDHIILLSSLVYTLGEALYGLVMSVILGYFVAILMDRYEFVRRFLYPVLLISQAIPYILIAPFLVLWLGYGMMPKVLLVTISCFFPIVVGVYDAVQNIPKEYIDDLELLGGSYIQKFFKVKAYLILPSFFSTLKISTTYSLISAVTSEWLGGQYGVGVYMIRVRKSYEFDKFFAAVFLVVAISLSLFAIIKIIEKTVLKNVT